MRKIHFSKKFFFVLVIFVVVGGPLATARYFYNRYETLRKNPDLITKEEIKTVTEGIKKYMELPGGEEPTLATVTDVEKLKEQDFFKKAQNGDKILIYSTAQKAILYRPSTGRVIEFAPLLIGEGSQQTEGKEQSQTQKQQSAVTVAIYNGTQVQGLSGEYEKKLAGISGLSVASKTNAAKTDYTKTLVVDLNGGYQDVAKQISQLVGGEVANKLPEGEKKPDADILVIAGKTQ